MRRENKPKLKIYHALRKQVCATYVKLGKLHKKSKLARVLNKHHIRGRF